MPANSRWDLIRGLKGKGCVFQLNLGKKLVLDCFDNHRRSGYNKRNTLFMVLTAAALKVTVFWYVTPCFLVNRTYSPVKHTAPVLKVGTYLRNYSVASLKTGDLWAIEIFYCTFNHLKGERGILCNDAVSCQGYIVSLIDE